MKNYSIFIIALIGLLMGCSSGSKKVFIIASGNVEVVDNNVTLGSGTSHNEKEFLVSGDKFSVTTPSGTLDFNVPENGIYILNLKPDTLVGSYQRTGTAVNQQVITQQDLSNKIDSLNLLVAGANVSAANRNYSIAPKQLARISDNTNAQIIGPYKNVPGSFEAGKEHEIYKFYTNKEMHEVIERLSTMVETKPAEE